MVRFRSTRRRLQLLAGGALLAVAGCGASGVDPTPSARSTVGTADETSAISVRPATQAPSTATQQSTTPPSATDVPTASPTPVVRLTQEERFLGLVLRADAAENCQPRRTGLPPRAVVGIECVIASKVVDRVGVYGFDYDDEAAALTYLERMDAYGALGATGDCLAGSPQDSPHDETPDGVLIEDGDQVEYQGAIYAQWRFGCFLNEHGIANFRATCGTGTSSACSGGTPTLQPSPDGRYNCRTSTKTAVRLILGSAPETWAVALTATTSTSDRATLRSGIDRDPDRN